MRYWSQRVININAHRKSIFFLNIRLQVNSGRISKETIFLFILLSETRLTEIGGFNRVITLFFF